MDSNSAPLFSEAPIPSLALPNTPKSSAAPAPALRSRTGVGEGVGGWGGEKSGTSLTRSCSQPRPGPPSLSLPFPTDCFFRACFSEGWVAAFSALRFPRGGHSLRFYRQLTPAAVTVGLSVLVGSYLSRSFIKLVGFQDIDKPMCYCV